MPSPINRNSRISDSESSDDEPISKRRRPQPKPRRVQSLLSHCNPALSSSSQPTIPSIPSKSHSDPSLLSQTKIESTSAATPSTSEIFENMFNKSRRFQSKLKSINSGNLDDEVKTLDHNEPKRIDKDPSEALEPTETVLKVDGECSTLISCDQSGGDYLDNVSVHSTSPDVSKELLKQRKELMDDVFGVEISPMGSFSIGKPALSSSEEELDPELTLLKKRIKNDIVGKAINQEGISKQKEDSTTSQAKIELDVETMEDPRNPDPSWDNKTVRFIVFEQHKFTKLFESFATVMQTTPEDVVFTYDDAPVFSAATPKSLNIQNLGVFSKASLSYPFPIPRFDFNEVEAYKRSVYEYIQLREEQVSHRDDEDFLTTLGGPDAISKYQGTPLEAENFLSLTLRAKGGVDTKLRVKLSDTVASLVATFAKENSLSSSKDISLEFEGEELAVESTVEELELEDEDMLTVHMR